MLLKITIVILCILIIAIIIITNYLSSYTCLPNRRELPDGIELLKKQGYWEDYDKLTRTHHTHTCRDGYVIHETYIPADEPADRYVIINHGYTSSRCGSVKYVLMFHELGYNCITYDDRGHGENAKCPVTFGVKESQDLMEIITETYERYGKDIYLGLHGESMGSGLQIMALKYHPNVRFIINDCGYADLPDILKGQLKYRFHLPAFLVPLASLANKRRFGYFFGEAVPIKYLGDNQIPICFIHGESDGFISYTHSQRMQKETAGYSEIHLFPAADHAVSYDSDPKRYKKIVKDFLTKISR